MAGGLAALGVGRGGRVAFLDKNNPACLEVSLGAGLVGAATGSRAAGRGQRGGPVAGDVQLGHDRAAQGVMLSHRNIVAHTCNSAPLAPMEPGDRNLVAMPLFHVGGTSYALFGIYWGMPSTFTREPDPASLLAAFGAGATHAFLVPAVVAGLLAGGERSIAALSGLKYLLYGAAPMPLPVLRQALAAWPRLNFIQVYGQTELSGVISARPAQAHRDLCASGQDRLTSAGTLLPGAELRVVDPATGKDVAGGQPGEFWFGSAQQMMGYLNRPADSAQAITADGWLRSGDIGHVDDGGFLLVSDRVKDMIITGGENVYSPEVEQAVAEHPAVAEVAVIGVPDEVWGESVKAIVVLRPGVSLSGPELIEFVRGRLAHYKCPRTVGFAETLPRTPSGKVLKRSLRDPYWAGRDRQI